jgi:uncharacterized protein YgbK (DUF1537 family)
MPTLADPSLNPTLLTPSHTPCTVRLLADDLTGACDAAVAFLGDSGQVRVWLGPQARLSTREHVQAFNTASRDLPARDAEIVVERAASVLAREPGMLFFKKVDSAARGPIGVEVLAAHRALGTKAILFAPAFPAAGRTVRHGMLTIRSSATEAMELPLTSLFAEEIQAQIAHIHSVGEISASLTEGKSILLCDAEQQVDLDDLVKDVLPSVLYTGSAGLARALANACRDRRGRKPVDLPYSRRTLIVCGSLHSATLAQLNHLSQHDPHAVVLCMEAANSASAVRASFVKRNPDALLLTGGETALLALQALNAHSIQLRGELAPGIPWGVVEGGDAHGRIVITKSGGFGEIDTLTRIHQLLQRDSAA